MRSHIYFGVAMHIFIGMASTTSEEVKLPKLDASGKDWTTWKVRLQLAAGSQGLGGYFDGSKMKPIDPATGKSVGWTVMTPDEIKLVEEYDKDIVAWTEKDTKVQHMIVNTLPNSLFVRLVDKDSVHKYFTTLHNLFEKRSLVVGAEMHRQLGELKLKDGRDAHAHIERIIALHEELASIGQSVLDEDLFNIIYASLLHSYNPSPAALSSMMCLHNKSVTSNDLMDIVLEEYDRLMLQDGRKKKSSGEDAAFGADASFKKGKWKGKRFSGNCNNCGWPGHKECNCWEEGGGKAGQAPKNWKSCGKEPKDEKSKKSSATANVTSTAEPDSAWFTTLDSGSSTNDHIDMFLA